MFKIGDKVDFKTKNRKNGTITNVFCGECIKCKTSQYKECIGDYRDKVKCSVEWIERSDNIIVHKTRIYRMGHLDRASEEDSAPAIIIKKEKKKQQIELPPVVKIPIAEEFFSCTNNFLGIKIK